VLFNSLTFIAFFAVVLVLHNAPLPWKVKKINLLLASYVFYASVPVGFDVGEGGEDDDVVF
jgi:hypothetical protein